MALGRARVDGVARAAGSFVQRLATRLLARGNGIEAAGADELVAQEQSAHLAAAARAVGQLGGQKRTRCTLARMACVFTLVMRTSQLTVTRFRAAEQRRISVVFAHTLLVFAGTTCDLTFGAV